MLAELPPLASFIGGAIDVPVKPAVRARQIGTASRA
jgi:hypothetical protein